MNRYFVPLAAVLALASTAHAQSVADQQAAKISQDYAQKVAEAQARAQSRVQRGLTPTTSTYSRTVTTNDGFGNSTSTTIEAPATASGLNALNVAANQLGYAGYCPPNYGYGYAGYPAPAYPAYGYPAYPAPAYPAYGYPAPYPAPYPYGYPPQAYYVPGQTTVIGTPSPFGWATQPTITSVPQVITTPGVPAYPYPYPRGGGYPHYGYGYSSRTTVAQGGISYNRGGVSVSVGGTAINRR